MDPYYDILGIEQTASHEEITAAYNRLNTYYDRLDKLESPEFTDIEVAYKTITEHMPSYPEDYIIDRKIWAWVTCSDKEGQWNILVRKNHKQEERKASKSTWNTSGGKSEKLKKETERKGNRNRKGTNSYDDE
jgi:hypothetical protein